MNRLRKILLSIAIVSMHYLGASSQEFVSIVIGTVENRTPFKLCLADRHATYHCSKEIKSQITTKLNYLIKPTNDIDVKNLRVNEACRMFRKQAQFKIAIIEDDGKRKEGKSSYIQVGIKSHGDNWLEDNVFVKHAHPMTNDLDSQSWKFAYCKPCRADKVDIAYCPSCQKRKNALIFSQTIVLDFIVAMTADTIENDTGKLILSCRVGLKK